MLVLILSGIAALGGIAYAIYLHRDEETRQELRRDSRATWVKS